MKKGPIREDRPCGGAERSGLAAPVFAVVPPVVQAVHESGTLPVAGAGLRRPTGVSQSSLDGAAGRRAQTDDHSAEHDGEAEDAHEWLSDDHARHEHRETKNAEQDAQDESPIVGTAATLADRCHEIGVILIEVPLHLVEEPLLVFRKRHLDPFRV